MATPVITAIVVPRRGSRARRIELDGAPWGTTCRDVVKELGLAEGDRWSPAALTAAVRQVEPACARRRALAMLSRAERSSTGLAERLAADGYPDEVARHAVEALSGAGIVDDGRFSESRARSLAARGYARARVARTLEAAGVASELAGAAAKDACGDDTARALDLARRLAPAARGSVERLAARLARRGFTASDSFAAARTALRAADEAQPPDLDA